MWAILFLETVVAEKESRKETNLHLILTIAEVRIWITLINSTKVKQRPLIPLSLKPNHMMGDKNQWVKK